MPETRAQIIIEGIDRFSRVAKSIERGLGGLERSALALSGVGRRLTLGVTMPMAGMGVMAVKTAAKFDTALKAIQAVGGHTEEQIEELGETFIRMSTDIKTTVDSAQTLADAFYLIQGSGFAGAEAMEVLEISTKAATAGLTSTDVAARAVTATLSAYTLGAGDARRVSDVLFRTVDIGVVSFEELASSIGGVIGSAAAAGVSIEEVGAAIATMTKAGYSGAESVTSLNMVIAAFLKPSTAMEEALERLGFESGEAMLRARGLEGSLELLRGEVERGTSEWEKMFGNVRAYRGVVALTRGEMQPFRADLEAIRSATEGAGATQKTFNKMIESAELQMTSLRRQLEAATLELGRALLPAFKDVLKTVTPLIRGFADLDEGTRSLFVRAFLLSTVLGPIAIGLSKVIDASRTLISVFGKATEKAAEKALALKDQTLIEEAAGKATRALGKAGLSTAGVFGIMGLAVGALAAGQAYLSKQFVTAHEELRKVEQEALRASHSYEEYREKVESASTAMKSYSVALTGGLPPLVELTGGVLKSREEFEKQRAALSDAEANVWKLREAWVKAREELGFFESSLAIQTEESLPTYQAAVLGVERSFASLAARVGETKEALSAHIAAMGGYLDALARNFGTASSAAENLRTSILGIPDRIVSQVSHNFGDAAAAAHGVKSAVEAIPSTRTVTIYTRYAGLYPMERGGIVPGPPGRPVPILAHAGELVLPAHVTRLLLEQRLPRPAKVAREIHFHYQPTFSFATALELRNAARELFRLVREEERRFA